MPSHLADGEAIVISLLHSAGHQVDGQAPPTQSHAYCSEARRRSLPVRLVSTRQLAPPRLVSPQPQRFCLGRATGAASLLTRAIPAFNMDAFALDTSMAGSQATASQRCSQDWGKSDGVSANGPLRHELVPHVSPRKCTGDREHGCSTHCASVLNLRLFHLGLSSRSSENGRRQSLHRESVPGAGPHGRGTHAAHPDRTRPRHGQVRRVSGAHQQPEIRRPGSLEKILQGWQHDDVPRTLT
ncbi:hypothetical protein ON010_g4206 [Phytophthora cinnamomi]|nr:hypothetical protein ON010_g4206 [Phytophthora cinnamomi]